MLYIFHCNYSLLQLALEHNRAKAGNANRQRRASESDSMQDRLDTIAVSVKNVDILQMLSKAQDEYDKVWYQVMHDGWL